MGAPYLVLLSSTYMPTMPTLISMVVLSGLIKACAGTLTGSSQEHDLHSNKDCILDLIPGTVNVVYIVTKLILVEIVGTTNFMNVRVPVWRWVQIFPRVPPNTLSQHLHMI